MRTAVMVLAGDGGGNGRSKNFLVAEFLLIVGDLLEKWAGVGL